MSLDPRFTYTLVSIHASLWEATTGTPLLMPSRLVSIHASAWEATPCLGPVNKMLGVSIHASAWEATGDLRYGDEFGGCFYPRLRMGGDPADLLPWLAVHVSIHASAWEATQVVSRTSRTAVVSIHASAWEATCECMARILEFTSFYPRLRMGGDARARAAPQVHLCFYPRLRMGGDHQPRSGGAFLCLFLSTPPHGRRPFEEALKGDYWGFLSTPPHGRRQPSATMCGERSGFYPRLRMGGDRCACGLITAGISFLSTPPHGRRPIRHSPAY